MLLHEHVSRFNAGVRSGDWSAMLELLADDAELEVVGLPVGPFVGRAEIAAAYAAQPPDDEIVLLDGWHAGTYGIPDTKTLAAIHLCARLEGVLTDPVYEGKSMAALIDLVRSAQIEPGSRVLYAHLGGQPALDAYAGAFSQS